MTGSEEASKSKVSETTNTKLISSQQYNTVTFPRPRRQLINTCADDKKFKYNQKSRTDLTNPKDSNAEDVAGNSRTGRGDDKYRSRSSSFETDIDSTRSNGPGRTVHGTTSGLLNPEIDKSVTSSSILVDEEHGGNLWLSDEDLELTSKGEMITLYHRIYDYIDVLKRRHEGELIKTKEAEGKLREERTEISRREKVLIMRLTNRDRQLVEVQKEMAQLKSSLIPSQGSLRSTLLDPAVNLIIQKLKKDVAETKKKLEDTQNDLNAWKFTPDSNTGKRLMAKCRMLYLENEDLGKQTSSGRVAKLETDLALNRQLVTEMKQSQAEMDEVVQELDEDIEGLQSAIQHLQQEVRTAHEKNATHSLVPDNCANNDMINLSLSVLCAQCRLTHSNKGSQGESAVRTSADFSSSSSSSNRTTSTSRVVSSPLSEKKEVEDSHEWTPNSRRSDKNIRTAGGSGGIENDERTSVINGELISIGDKNAKTISPSSSPDYSKKSVQRVVNSSSSSSNSNSPSTPQSLSSEREEDEIDVKPKRFVSSSSSSSPSPKRSKLSGQRNDKDQRHTGFKSQPQRRRHGGDNGNYNGSFTH